MRELKFRAWDKEKEELHNDLYIKWLSPTLKRATKYSYNDFGDVHHLQLNDALANDKDFTLTQYIGKKDKNGVEIYENDFLTDGTNIVEVVWDNDNARFIFDSEHFYLSGGQTLFWEIIGNRFENPELLK